MPRSEAGANRSHRAIAHQKEGTMSQVTDTAATRFSVPLLAWAALALATMAVAVVLILAVTSGGQEEGTRGPFRYAPIQRDTPAVRYDGGPEEGTAAQQAAR